MWLALSVSVTLSLTHSHSLAVDSGGSGLSVIGPPPDAAAGGGAASSSSSSVFDGLKAQASQEASLGDDENVYRVTRYRNGFTINDGPLMDAESPEGRNFFSRMQGGYLPREIEELEAAKGNSGRGAPTNVVLVDKRSEDYVAPLPTSKDLFKKEGATIGKKADCGDEHCLVFTEGNTTGSAAPTHDPSQPTTQLAVKGPDGRPIKFKINSSVPLSLLGAVLVQQLGLPHGGENGFTVTSGFPAKCLEAKDANKTLLELGLTNTQISHVLKT